MALTGKSNHGHGTTHYWAAKWSSHWTDKNKHVCNGLQLYAVVLTFCNCLDSHQVSWQHATVLAVCNCLDSLQLSWQSATILKLLNCLNGPWVVSYRPTANLRHPRSLNHPQLNNCTPPTWLMSLVPLFKLYVFYSWSFHESDITLSSDTTTSVRAFRYVSSFYCLYYCKFEPVMQFRVSFRKVWHTGHTKSVEVCR